MSDPRRSSSRVGPAALAAVAALVLIGGRTLPGLRGQQGIVWVVVALLLLLAVVVATAGRRGRGGGR